jgi:hypothetical protein
MIFRQANIDEVGEAILVLLHWHCVHDLSMEFTFPDIWVPLSTKYHRNVVVLVVDELLEKKYLTKIGYDTYSITKAGLLRAEAFGEIIYARRANSLGLLEEGGAVESQEHDYVADLIDAEDSSFEIPASDRVVTLNHNQPDYQQAVEALDKVLEEFRNDHRLDNELGPQKEAHLKVLEGGRKALEDKEISVENGQNWIVAPLKWIAEKYADGTVKAAAVEALKWALKLLGLGN